jgi:hypothetical protein
MVLEVARHVLPFLQIEREYRYTVFRQTEPQARKTSAKFPVQSLFVHSR